MFLIFDTETTGLPKNWNAPYTDSENWPRLVQLAWQLHDEKGELLEVKNFIVKPQNYTIPYNAEKIHGISTERAMQFGADLEFVLEEFNKALAQTQFMVGHNVSFDINIVGAEFYRTGQDTPMMEMASIDTKEEATEYCALPGGRGGKFKWPNLTELHQKLFGEGFDEAHNASADVEATSRCFLELVRLGVVSPAILQFNQAQIDAYQAFNPQVLQPIGLNIEPYNPHELAGDLPAEEPVQQADETAGEQAVEWVDPTVQFTHLHVHTQYSILDGAAKVPNLIKKAKADGMEALAITDHGNMFGVKLFHKIANKEGIKPILGCEVYVARRTRFDKERIDKTSDHLILLAKNKTGYHNLMKMVSYAWLEGYYYKPRIDKDLLREYGEGIVASSACLGGEISQRIMNDGIEEAEKALLEYKQIFGPDFYLELQRHRTGIPARDKKVYDDQVFVNRELLKLGAKHGVKCIATNDSHFINAGDAEAHDRLVCINTGKDVDDPDRMRYTGQEWLKSRAEMAELFKDLPETLTNTQEIVDKIESYPLDCDPIMPEFVLPEGFDDADEYLRHLTYEGAKFRWGEVEEDVRERIDFELDTIKNMGFPGYFLITWDFIRAAREMGVSVGPGRGSAAGSAVAYCLRITEIDPVKYHLLFERFLNPDRISMPDIDIDFDEEGRGKVLEWVVNKYGAKRVAHIITFGTMAPKMAIRDVARVQKLPLSDSDRLAKLVPAKPGTSFKDALEEVPELRTEYEHGTPEIASVLKFAETLEGSIRNTGTHACGIIIGRDDLEEHVPISTAKDSELTYVTQYDGKHVEDIGLLKMDFLGLKTLSIIKDAVENVKLSQGIDVDIDHIPLDDKETYDLYSRGETTALFQFESEGMKKYLRELQPTRFEDLIAMNALYRPGPMEYIPQFVARKHGREPIEYDIPIMEEYLKETYGITVYQEQVMLLSRSMGGFTRGQSDSLRKAMGKKIKAMMDELKVKFVEGCEKNNLDAQKVEKVWSDWEAFAKYAFNKSHATCYSYVSYQTGYLKAHYPAEFMAAVLSRNMNDIKKITFFIEECKHMGLSVLGPDVNESRARFTVNKKGEIRFGMAAMKGVGEAAVEAIIEEREANGPYRNVVDLVKRVNLRTVNRKSLETMAQAGCFDSFQNTWRSQYFYKLPGENSTFLEKLVRYGNQYQANLNSAQVSLFGDVAEAELPDPDFPKVEPWGKIEKLKKEKDVIGFFLSGHPLDEYKLEIKRFCNTDLATINAQLLRYKGMNISFAGIVTIPAVPRTTAKGKPFGIFTLEDFSESREFALFGDDFLKFKQYIETEGQFLLINGTVAPRWRGSEDLELKITGISLLSEVMDKKVSNITLNIPLNKISEDLIDQLENAIADCAGGCKVSFKVIDPAEGISLLMPSRSAKVRCSEFIKRIHPIDEIDCLLS